MKFYPYKKGGEKSCSHAEVGGHKKFLGCFYMLAILMGGAISFHSLKGRAQKVSDPQFCSPPSP